MSFDHPDRDAITLEGVLHALADPVRLGVVRALAERADQTCCEAAPFEVPKSTLSNHYKILRAAGLIETRKAGVYAHSRLRREDVDARFPGLLEAVLAAKAAEPA